MDKQLSSDLDLQSLYYAIGKPLSTMSPDLILAYSISWYIAALGESLQCVGIVALLVGSAHLLTAHFHCATVT